MIFYYVLVFMLPMPDHPLWSRTVGPMTIIKVVGVLCLLSALARAALKGSLPPILRVGAARWYLLYFLVAMTSEVIHGGTISLGPTVFANLLAVLSLFISTALMVDSLRRLRIVLLVVIVSEAICSLYVIRQWQAFHNVYADFRSWGGAAGDPNYYAISAVIWMPVSLFWLISERPRWEKRLCLGCLVITFLGLTLSASRGGFLGMLASAPFFLWNSRRRLRNLVLLLLLVVPFSLLSSTSPLKRLTHPTQSDEEAADSRVEIWKVAWPLVQASPIFGVGHIRFVDELQQHNFTVVHNTYLEIAGVLGILGFVPYMGMLVSTLRSLTKVVRRARENGPPMVRITAMGLRAGLAGFMVSATFLTTLWQQVFWLAVFLSACLPLLERESSRLAAACEPVAAGEVGAGVG
ncbi:MAG TPA: O-antigen ligase family protein [Terriglobia bacterium]|jgi:O-antigen ligase|nr:O-antigen ligase family protein [Terriglobia bacterium]